MGLFRTRMNRLGHQSPPEQTNKQHCWIEKLWPQPSKTFYNRILEQFASKKCEIFGKVEILVFEFEV